MSWSSLFFQSGVLFSGEYPYIQSLWKEEFQNIDHRSRLSSVQTAHLNVYFNLHEDIHMWSSDRHGVSGLPTWDSLDIQEPSSNRTGVHVTLFTCDTVCHNDHIPVESLQHRFLKTLESSVRPRLDETETDTLLAEW